MKRLFYLLASAAILSGCNTAQAQSFVTQSGSSDSAVRYWGPADGSDLLVYNNVKSTGGNIYLKWNLTSLTLGTGWTLTGICDNAQCINQTAAMAGRVSDAYTASNFTDFHAYFSNVNNAPYNTYSVAKVTMKDTISGTTRNITFIGYKSAMGVANAISSSDDVIIFPNPAREAVNVVFDDKAGVRTIAIYNLIGKAMKTFRPTDNNSAKLDLDGIPGGVYFLRLMDGQGHVLATRRFTHQ